METKRKINSLGFLRGLAVVLVCFCHFSYAITLAKHNAFESVFKAFSLYGRCGVNIFFVISGFIIPFSMNKAKYNLKYYFKFLVKRTIRLHPPYLVALFLTLIIVAVANRVKQIPFPEDTTSIIKSLFYFHAPGDNPVFWTLKIEAQYYIFMGIYFAILNKDTKLTLCLSIPFFMFLSQTNLVNYIGLFDFLIFFLIGTVGYLIYNKNESYLLEIVCLSVLIIFSFVFYELSAAIAALVTILFILFYKGKVNKGLDFLGEVSYSVYLIHYPIGIKLINLTIKYLNPNYYVLLFIFTNLLVLAISFIFWKFIENSSAKLSNKIRYGNRQKAPKRLVIEDEL